MAIRAMDLSDWRKDVSVLQTDSETVALLGRVIWYSIREKETHKDVLERALIESGVGDEWMPKAIRIPDAFRRATKAVERQHVNEANGTVKSYLIRDVYNDAKITQRNIVVEIRQPDGNGRMKLRYKAEIAALELLKDHGLVQVAYPSGEEDGMAVELAERAKELFEINLTHYDAAAIRRIVQGVLASMAPVSMRDSGGIYFVPIKFKDRLDGLVGFIQSLGGTAYTLPVVRTSENLDMIRAEAHKMLEKALRRISEADSLAEGMPTNELERVTSEADAALKVVEEYESILGDMLDKFRHGAAQIERYKRSLRRKEQVKREVKTKARTIRF